MIWTLVCACIGQSTCTAAPLVKTSTCLKWRLTQRKSRVSIWLTQRVSICPLCSHGSNYSFVLGWIDGEGGSHTTFLCTRSSHFQMDYYVNIVAFWPLEQRKISHHMQCPVAYHCHCIISPHKHTGIATASGLAATTMLCQLLKSGDHIVAMDDLYGGQLMIIITSYRRYQLCYE